MTVTELRKALEGLPDDMPVAFRDLDTWINLVRETAIQELQIRGEHDIGDFVETWTRAGTGEPLTVFVLS
jgi:hypothetical protein